MESYPNRTTFDDGDVLDGGTDMDQMAASRAGASAVDELSNDVAGAKNRAADMLHGAKDRVERVSESVKDRAERVSESVKNKVSTATNYVKTAHAEDMWGDVKELARRNPGASMLAFAVIGFAIGRSTSRSDSR